MPPRKKALKRKRPSRARPARRKAPPVEEESEEDVEVEEEIEQEEYVFDPDDMIDRHFGGRHAVAEIEVFAGQTRLNASRARRSAFGGGAVCLRPRQGGADSPRQLCHVRAREHGLGIRQEDQVHRDTPEMQEQKGLKFDLQLQPLPLGLSCSF